MDVKSKIVPINQNALSLARVFITRFLNEPEGRRLVYYSPPDRHKSYVQYFFEHAERCGIELLKDDMDFIWNRCKDMRNVEMKPYLSRYKQLWIEHMNACLEEHKKQNKGSYAANSYLLDALPEPKKSEEFEWTLKADVITRQDVETYLKKELRNFGYDAEELLRVYKQYVQDIDISESQCLNCGYNRIFCNC